MGVCIRLLEPGMLAHLRISNKKSMDDAEFYARCSLEQSAGLLTAWDILDPILKHTYPHWWVSMHTVVIHLSAKS